jgi:hypothetical protein
VSRIRYVHAVTSFLRRRPFGHVILMLLVLPIILVYTELSALIAAWSFTLSGPVRAVLNRLKPPLAQTGPPAVSTCEPEHNLRERQAQ